MTSVRGRRRPAYRGQAPKGPIGPASNKFDNKDHKDPLKSNKSGPSEAPTEPFKAFIGPFKALAGPFQASLAQNPGANCYSQQDLNRIIQTFSHISKGGSGDKFKAKTLDVYRSKFHMEYYNFCQ